MARMRVEWAWKREYMLCTVGGRGYKVCVCVCVRVILYMCVYTHTPEQARVYTHTPEQAVYTMYCRCKTVQDAYNAYRVTDLFTL